MTRYFKLLRKDLTHHGFSYKEGLNVLNMPFDESACGGRPGGLYFSEEKDILSWLHYYDDYEWITEVTIPPGARGVVLQGELKADRIICGPFMRLSTWKAQFTELDLVTRFGMSLLFVEEQTPAVCVAAIKRRSEELLCVNEQDHYTCLCAVETDGMALAFVENRTPMICLAAVLQCRDALQFVPEITPAIALLIADRQTPAMCLDAVRKEGRALQVVREQTPEICMAAIQQDGSALKFVREQTPELCLAAVYKRGINVAWIRDLANLELVKKQIPKFAGLADIYIKAKFRKD